MPEWNVVVGGEVVDRVRATTYPAALTAAQQKHGKGAHVSAPGNPQATDTVTRRRPSFDRSRDERGKFSCGS